MSGISYWRAILHQHQNFTHGETIILRKDQKQKKIKEIRRPLCLCLYFPPTLPPKSFSALFSTHSRSSLFKSSDNKNFWQLRCSWSDNNRHGFPTFCSQHCRWTAGLCWEKPELIFAPRLVECCQMCHTWASLESAESVFPADQSRVKHPN